MKQPLSIHPRNWPNGNGVISNTCDPHGTGKRKGLRKASERLNRRRVAHAATVAGNKNESAYRKPGSMKRKGK